MKIFQIIVCVSFIFNSSGEDVEEYISDIGLNTKALILKYGYPYESHTVQTDDGYLLKLQRIPYGKNYTQSLLNKIPVLLMPGLLCDAAVFINMGNKSLAFILADNGYDVWLANYRGSTLSRRHVTLNPDVHKKKFWNFSFQEIGYYDVPKFIDHILAITKQKSLHYIGHSQGMTTYFVTLSDKPHYAKKIRAGVALSPATTTKHTASVVKSFAVQFEEFIKNYTNVYESYEILPLSEQIVKAGAKLCRLGSPFLNLCADIILFIVGWTPHQMNKERISVMLTNTPSGSSIKQLQHFLQLQNGVFHKYDYGVEGNMKEYGQEHPPKYNLTNATPPIAIYHGDMDWVIDPKDIEKLASQLPNLIKRKVCHGFNHLDVIWGIDASKLIFKDILNFLKQYD